MGGDIPAAIAAARLRDRRACGDPVALFEATFGAETPLARANLARAAGAGLDLDRLAERLLDVPALRAFAEAAAAAGRAYEEAVAAARRAFLPAAAATLADALGLPAGDGAASNVGRG